MIKMIRHAAVLMALAALTVAGVGCAHETDGEQEARRVERVEQRVEQAMDDIDATPAQRERIRGQVDGLLESFRAFRGQHEATHETVERMWLQDEPDEKKAHALVDARIDAIRGLAHQVTDAVLVLHDTLTPSQRRVVIDKIEEHRRSWRDRWHGGEEH